MGVDAQTYPLTYGGRLTDSSGAPLAGSVDLEVNFYGSESGASKLGRSPFVFAATPTVDGVFSISLDLTPDDLAALFDAPGSPTWIEIVDRTHGRTYPRQRFAAVPQALRVPLDEETLEFDASGRLRVKSVPSAHIPELAASLQSKADASAVATLQAALSGKMDASAALSGDLSGTVDAAVVAALQGWPVSAAAPGTGQVLTFDGIQWVADAPVAAAPITSSSVVNAGSLTSTHQAGVELKPFDTGAGKTGELRFDALSDGNYVGFKAPDAIAAPTVWTLPAGDGASGNVLTTNGSGTLAWSALPSAPVSSVAGRTGTVTLSTSDVSEGSALYYTAARARAALSGTGPITVDSSTGAIGITQASGSASGYLSSTDWTTFNGKQAALGYSPVNKAGDTMSGDLAMGSNKITGLADPTAAADAASKGYADSNLGGVVFDQAARTNDYVIKWDAGSSKYYLATDQTGTAGGGITTINGLNASGQTLLMGASGTAPAVSSSGSTHTINVPMASGAGVTAGLISKADYDAFNGKQAAITAASTVNAGTVTTALQNGVELKPYGTGAGQTGETRFGELSANGSNYVALKAADSLAGNVVWTLPVSEGTSGEILQTDGAGGLSWASVATLMGAAGGDLTGTFPNPTLAGSGVTPGTYPKVTVDAKGRVTSGSSTITSTDIADGTIANADISGAAAIATSKLSGAVTAISGHGLGSLATLSAVGSSEISDGAISNADISGTAEIATSKLSGAVTSISGHGLGLLATLSAVGSSEITNGSIADADVSGSAAIATSKLSGALTAISGHGLGSLATLSAIGGAEITDSSVASTDIVDGTIANADISGTAQVATSKLSGAVTSIAGHGLGSLAALSTVASAQITDATIVDADISGSAAISSTKISFVADSISGNAIDGGVISSFQSTGIDDNASAVAMTINSSGSVGIGTTAPDETLTVNGSIKMGTASSPYQHLTLSGGNSNGYLYGSFAGLGDGIHLGYNAYYDAAGGFVRPVAFSSTRFSIGYDSFVFATTNDYTGATQPQERMRITGSGNVGIGTTAPYTGLHLANAGAATTFSLGNAVNTKQFMQIGTGADAAGYSYLQASSFNTAWNSLAINPSGGSVGIGTTAPWTTLSIGSPTAATTYLSIDSAAANQSAIEWRNAGTSKWILYRPNSSSDLRLYDSAAGADRVSFQSNTGNVGIGTTAPTQKLSVAGTVESTTGGFKFPDGTLQTTAGGAPDYILITHSLADGTDGGSVAANTWNIRPFNTEVTDTGGHASVAGNVITLAAGTYECDISSIVYEVTRSQARLYNITAGSVIAYGTVVVARYYTTPASIIKTRFTLASESNLRVEQNAAAAQGTNGFGFASDWTGNPEVYATFQCYRY
jgi:hypothetical protein